MPKVKITETVLRDAHQSLIATRMSIDEMLPIMQEMDKIGYYPQRPGAAQHLMLVSVSSTRIPGRD